MQCPRCHNLENKVIDSRLTEKNRAIRRRRECEKCQFRFTTLERVRIESLIVIKKDQTREAYDRSKIEQGIWKACEKRPVTQEQIDSMLSELEEEWTKEREIETTKLGEDVMNRLKNLDDVAYIRFASVYRQFKDIESFQKELKALKGSEK